ncbi:MAG: heavy-metal-associated domain-containing protein [Candidatus Eisenbacteria bacterium]|uniref:Heavy-metal-associated domain-containing protein n=1 Tax=Eiseniibacteriota bacterium TaxID=2212470 RepID=A0A849SGU9_UNCEI|nr:heavy-metal-associated domain-containing protein [Candidatus Eisenbacteria bacterium]
MRTLLVVALCWVVGCSGAKVEHHEVAARDTIALDTLALDTLALDTLALAAANAVPLPTPGTGERLVTLEVGGMVCPACIYKVGKSLREVSGVRAAVGDLSAQRFDVVCQSDLADTALTRAVRRAGSQYLGLVVSR